MSPAASVRTDNGIRLKGWPSPSAAHTDGSPQTRASTNPVPASGIGVSPPPRQLRDREGRRPPMSEYPCWRALQTALTRLLGEVVEMLVP